LVILKTELNIAYLLTLKQTNKQMKKLVLAVAALGLVSLTSCKKEYTCECSYNGTVIGSAKIKDTKKKAKDACTGLNTSYAAFGSGVNCAIK
jgi:phage-related protein